jgi:hypothetical protein
MPPTSNRAKQQVFLEGLRRGMTRTAAAAAAGVDRSTPWKWAERSIAFGRSIEGAEAEFERRMVDQLDLAARRGSWRAALALLERRLPDGWQQRSTLAVEGGVDDLSQDERSALTSVREWQAMTPDERAEDEREALHRQIDEADTDRLLELRARIDKLLSGYPHISGIRAASEPSS